MSQKWLVADVRAANKTWSGLSSQEKRLNPINGWRWTYITFIIKIFLLSPHYTRVWFSILWWAVTSAPASRLPRPDLELLSLSISDYQVRWFWQILKEIAITVFSWLRDWQDSSRLWVIIADVTWEPSCDIKRGSAAYRGRADGW